jgi:hypothetical protein
VKTLFTMIALLVSFSTYASSGLRSLGKDLRCDAQIAGYSKFYSCETPYGPSDKCHDFSSNAHVSFNVIEGDLASGLSGQIAPISITTVSSSGNNEIDQRLLEIINEHALQGFVSYQDKVITMRLETSAGEKTIVKSQDFSAGQYHASSSLSVEEPYTDLSGLNVSIYMTCRASTSANN